MSTEVAIQEPPKQEVQPTPEERKATALSLMRPKVQVGNITSQAPEPVQKKVEPVKQDEIKKVDEAAKTTSPDPKEQSIAELRKSRDEERKQREQFQKDLEAEKAERARIAAEYEEHKKKPASEEFLKKHQELEAERNKLDQELRVAALERSPSFQKKFREPINQSGAVMVDQMVASGVDRAEAIRAINVWDENFFGSVSANMSAAQDVKFKAAWMRAEQLEAQRQAELANADAVLKEQENQSLQQQKAQMEQQQSFLKQEEEGMFKELFSAEGLRENQELQTKAREAVAASYQFTPRQLMHSVATSRILADAVLMKDQELATLKAEKETLKKQLEEQAEFIKNANAGVARVSPTDPLEKPADKKARAQSFLNPTVRG